MTISTNIHLLRPVFTIQGYVPTPSGPDLSFSRWPRCYKSRRSFPVYLAALSAKAVQCPRPGPNIGNKSQQIPRYSPLCPRGQPPGWLLISALSTEYLFIPSPLCKRPRYYKLGAFKTVRFPRQVAECMTKLPENVSQEHFPFSIGIFHLFLS